MTTMTPLYPYKMSLSTTKKDYSLNWHWLMPGFSLVIRAGGIGRLRGLAFGGHSCDLGTQSYVLLLAINYLI